MNPLIDKALSVSISSALNSASNSALNSALFSALISASDETGEPQSVGMTLTQKSTIGLFFIQRYRYLTITQVTQWGFDDPHVQAL